MQQSVCYRPLQEKHVNFASQFFQGYVKYIKIQDTMKESLVSFNSREQTEMCVSYNLYLF